MPQLHLNFTDIPIPEKLLWEQFEEEWRQDVVETLARLIAKAARTGNQQEQTND